MSKLLQYLVNKPSVKHKVLPGLQKMQMAGQYNAERDTTSFNTPILSKMLGAQFDASRFKLKKQGGPVVDPRGQWAHPGKRTIVPTPTGRITMQGVPYPVYGQDETGFGQMMYPGGEYKFPGQMVDEMPMLRNGGGIVKMQEYQNGGEEGLLKKVKKEVRNFISKEIVDPYTMKSLYFLDALKPINNREIYETIRPVEYPNIQKLPAHAYNYVMGNKTEPLKEVSGRPHISEEFWATALNIPMEKQYLKESQYKPSKAKNPNAKYYTIRDIIDQDELLGITKDLKPGEKRELNGMLPILDSKWYSKNRKSSEGIDFEELDPLQRYTLEKSPDGSYVSIYDEYDFDNPALSRMLNPVEIYDRFYIDKKANKQSKLLPSSPKKKNGGQYGSVLKMQSGGQKDSTLENIVEVFDPTGISSWDDVYRSANDPSSKWYDTAVEVVGALPLVGKLGKLAKAGIHLKKYKGLEKAAFNMIPKSTSLSNTLQGAALLGRGSDAIQAGVAAPKAPFFPSAPSAGVGQFGRYAGMPSFEKKNGGQHGGLDRWFAEKWVDVKTGKACGRQEGEKRAGYPACRPSKRVSSETPKTSSEMSSAEKAKFKRSKTSSERIPYNHKK